MFYELKLLIRKSGMSYKTFHTQFDMNSLLHTKMLQSEYETNLIRSFYIEQLAALGILLIRFFLYGMQMVSFVCRPHWQL